MTSDRHKRYSPSLCATCAGHYSRHKRHTPLGGVTDVTVARVIRCCGTESVDRGRANGDGSRSPCCQAHSRMGGIELSATLRVHLLAPAQKMKLHSLATLRLHRRNHWPKTARQ